LLRSKRSTAAEEYIGIFLYFTWLFLLTI